MATESASTLSSSSKAVGDLKAKHKRHRRPRHVQHKDDLSKNPNKTSDLALRTFVNLDASANSSRSDIFAPSMAATISTPISELSNGSDVDDLSSRNEQMPYINPRSSSKPSRSGNNTISPSQAILHLMKITQGRMRGHVFLRKLPQDDWQSTHCAIRGVGSFNSEDKDTGALVNSEMDDLRGIRVTRLADKATGFTILQIRSADGIKIIQIRPKKQKSVDTWFAALLCWQAVLPNQKPSKKPHNSSRLPHAIIDKDHFRSRVDSTRTKSARALLLEKTCRISDIFPYSDPINSSPQTDRITLLTKPSNVFCTVNENGYLRIISESRVPRTTVAQIYLNRFPRSAVQHVDKRVFDQDLVVGIYPQYAFSNNACSQLRPIFLAFDSVEEFEIWFVLLKALAQPELYGFDSAHAIDDSGLNDVLPGIDNKSSTLFRIESSLCVQIIRAKLNKDDESSESTQTKKDPRRTSGSVDISKPPPLLEYDAEILVDEQVKVRTKGSERCAWYESLDLDSLSPYYSTLSIRINKTESNNEPQATTDPNEGHVGGTRRKSRTGASEPIGGVILDRADLTEICHGSEQSLPIIGAGGLKVGEVSVKFERMQEEILSATGYDGVYSQIASFSNKLTLKIWRHIPLQLSKLAEVLLNIFLESGYVEEWLESLADDEIRNGPSQAAMSKKSKPAVQDESLDNQNSGRSEIGEASILFRSNTLCTKALDFYMKRHGRKYLAETLGDKLQQIVNKDLDCEVDPSRLKGPGEAQLYHNWERLLDQAKDVWNAIYESASRCPQEMRRIFRHIRESAYARYGKVMPSVLYSSVSGFLFLRFFCASVMTPQLFGLVKGNPSPRANRTFLLIAKSLQGLANMTTFGSKEPWMSPMNTFCAANRDKFKEFLDKICEIPEQSDHQATQHAGQYASSKGLQAPKHDEFLLDVYYTLDQRAREGLPSLPHLIDRPQNLAKLVNLWLDNVDKELPSNSDEGEDDEDGMKPSVVTLRTLNSIIGEDNDLARFHASCQAIRHNSERVSGNTSRDEARNSWSSDYEADYMVPSVMQTWVKLAEHMESDPGYYWASDVPPLPSPRLAALLAGGPDEPSTKDALRPLSNTSKSEKSRRSYVGMAPSSDKIHRSSKSSDSQSSEKKKTSSRKREPSPNRGPEENALRKLGWL